jgi:2',3'-cyclic-nucleotide 2'-phosphodiesterase (5'-nucleotidase family)
MAVTRGGGRAPTTQDNVESTEDTDDAVRWEVSPTTDLSEARLIILQITDVYALDNFASFKTLLEETRRRAGPGSNVICMLTGDFLSPYLLSSVDRGSGMMHALNRVPMDYLTWGNHEADIDHRTVCRHVRNFKGKWLNSNMLDHDAMESQHEYDIVEVTSADGSQTRRVGLVAVLSNDPALYEHFDDPGAFGGATIDDPWETLAKYQAKLKEQCDVIVPLQHLYVPDDHRTCREFDFPVILSGHDHHRVDEVVEGTRLLKPGMNGVYATVLELLWKDKMETRPKIRARFVKVDDWPADPVLAEECDRAYDALVPLRNTELARVPRSFEPLSSLGSRESVCTMGRYVCTLIRSAVNAKRRKKRGLPVDAVLLMGGNIRGNADYAPGSYFSMEALEAEIKSDEVVGIVPMPGWLLAEGVEATHSGDPIPGWMQFDDGVRESIVEGLPIVTHVGGEPLDRDRIYRVVTKISDLTNGQSQPWTSYYKVNSYLLPPKGNYINLHFELMSFFARNLWRKLWKALSLELAENCDYLSLDDDFDDCEEDCNAEGRLKALDYDGDGVVTVEEMQRGFHDLLGYNVDDREMTLAKFVHSFADTTGDGRVTLEDFQALCEEL